MSDVNLRCVSLATGALGPDLRMNYQFGLVLGVDEFRQEQEYFLEKSYLHNRALHGYGTVYGLNVTATRPPDNTHEVLVTVEPGMGIDQWGRPFVLRDPQCARLGAWLAAQEQAHPGTIQDRQGPSGDLHIYVVASYDMCDDALVPIPGQPCSSSADTQVASRIRDSFNIELRWEPPPQPAWDAVRRFARLMAQVRIVAGLPPAQSDEAQIIALVRDLDQPDQFDADFLNGSVSSPPGSGAAEFRLPAETAREALDRIFTVWVTEVRPRLQPDLTDPSAAIGDQQWDPAVLLARIDFVPDQPFNTKDPRIADVVTPVDENRPYLLHTQLIQELLLLGGGGEAVAQKGEREFATIWVRNSQSLVAWVHHPAPLVFPPPPLLGVALRSGGRPLAIAQVNAVPGVDNLFEITTRPGNLIAQGDRVELTFRLQQLRIRNGGPLLPTLDALAFDYVGRDQNHLTVFTHADRLPTVQEFVTFTTVVPPQERTRLNAWFHVEGGVILPDTLDAARDPGGATVPFRTAIVGPGPRSVLWELIPTGDGGINDGDLLIFDFDAAQIEGGAAGGHVDDLIATNYLAFLGYDGDHTIHAFHAVEVPQSQAQPPPGLTWEDLEALPLIPFVTITPVRVVPSESLVVELWFHLDRDPRDLHFMLDGLKQDGEPMEVFGEILTPPQNGALKPLPVRSVQQMGANLYVVTLDPGRWRQDLRNTPYLRFVFPTDRLGVAEIGGGGVGSLTDYINRPDTRTKFEGHCGKTGTIVAYVRLPIQGGNG